MENIMTKLFRGEGLEKDPVIKVEDINQIVLSVLLIKFLTWILFRAFQLVVLKLN